MDELKKTTLFPEWKELYSVARTWQYDEIHPHKEIETILNISRSAREKYYSNIYRVRDELLKNDALHMINVPNVGYVIVHPNKAPKVADKYADRADRATDTAIDLLINVRHKEMSDISISITQHKLDRLMHQKTVTATTKVDMLAKSQELPKLPMSPPRPDKYDEEIEEGVKE